MARSNFSGAWGHNLQLEVFSAWNAPNIEGNFSTVNVQVRLIANGYAALWGATGKLLSLNVGGIREDARVDMSISQGQVKALWAKDYLVNHNPDGTKNITISATLHADVSNYGSAAASFNLPLTNIPRASSITAPNSVIGSNINITVNRAANTFKHAIRCAWYGKNTVIANDVDTSFAWTIPKDFANDIPNSESGWGTLIVETYSGGKKIGEKSTTFTATVPDNIKPTLTGFTLTDTNTAAASVVPGEQAFIQILSNIKVNFGQATGAYGSTITGYYAEIVGKNQSTTTQGGSLGIMNYSGNVTIRASVTDSRGRTSNTIERTVNILEYFAPILNISAARSGAQSSTLTITRNAKVAPLTVNGVQKNQMKLTFKVAKFGSNDYKVDTGSASGTWTTVSSLVNSNANLQGEYAANSSWTVLGILEDKFTSSEFAVNVATEQVVLSYDRYGIGVGKIRERGALDVKGNTYIDGFLRHCVEWAGDVSTNDLIEGGDAWTNKDTPNNDWGVLETFKIGNVSEKEATQRFTHRNGGKVWYRYRHYQTGNWTPWVVEGIDNFYPVGSIYQSTAPTNPTTFMGGVWERFGNGRVLVGVDEADADFNTANKTGGEKTHTLTIDEMPSHSHRQYVSANNGNDSIRRDWSSDGASRAYDQGMETGRAGGNRPHNNLQPYVTLYRWRRTA
nr:MAG TPA_asm: Baseplate structural protein [Caudoviricetes sp.]